MDGIGNFDPRSRTLVYASKALPRLLNSANLNLFCQSQMEVKIFAKKNFCSFSYT